MLDRWARVHVLNHEVSLTETLLYVPLTLREQVDDVGARLRPSLQVDSIRRNSTLPRLNEWRPLGQRLLRIKHCRQLLVLDVDEPQRLVGRVGVDRGDRRDRLAHKPHLVPRHRRLLPDPDPPLLAPPTP